MSTFVSLIPNWGGSSPTTSASYTPGGAGNSLFFLAASGGGNSIAFVMTGSVSSGFSNLATLSPTGGGTRTLIDCASCASGAQTFTVNDQISNFDNVFEGIEYSGVGSISNAALTNVASPGTGAGAILGASVVVPTGSLLIACCYEGTSGETVSSVGGTSRGSGASNPVYAWVEYAGAGSAIQPAFTTASNGTLTYLVAQFMLNPQAFSLSAAPGAFNLAGANAYSAFQLDGAPGSFVVSGQAAGLTALIPFAQGLMPNVTGVILQEALQFLQDAGILVPSKIGYFGTYPVTVKWIPGALGDYGIVHAQSIAAGTPVAPNSPITLVCSDLPINVAFP